MSEEQMEQASIELIQRYHALKKQFALLDSKLTGWENTFSRLGREMVIFKSSGVPSSIHYPNAMELNNVLDDFRATASELERARQQMKAAGINLS